MDEPISLPLTPGELERLAVLAGRRGVTPAELAAWLLAEALEREPGAPNDGAGEAPDRTQQEALLHLARHAAVNSGDTEAAFRAISEVAARALGVARASIWLYGDEETKILCVDLFERGVERHSQGAELRAVDFPAYFKALAEDRVIPAHEAQTDPRTREFTEPYLVPHGIGAMLDAPIHFAGRPIGVVCHEHVGGARRWSPEEQAFAGSIGDMVSLALEHAERQRAEAALLRQALELDKVREVNQIKTDFVNAISHELRTPLTTIMGYAEFLEDEISGSPSEANGDYVRQIHESARRLRRLVDDLLDVARLEARTFQLVTQPIELGQQIREVNDSLHPQAQRAGLALETRLPAQPLWVQGDRGQIEQVLINLVGNALKFTPAGGSVRVTACARPGSLRVEVTDTGPGIPVGLRDRLFDRFFQADASLTRARGGAGLGLSIAKALVEAQGGTIGLDSEPGRGSTFWFELPALAAHEVGGGSSERPTG